MKVHGNDTGLEREREKVVKENWKVGRTINQDMQEEKFNWEERWKW